MSTPLTSRPLIEKPSASSGEFGTEEDLTAEPGIEKEVDDEMGELSDSLSSNLSISRPTTPSQPIITRPSTSSATETYEPFSLAHKAERILGLSRGSLAHARACLENARDEVRRTGNSSTPSPSSEMPPSGAGMKSRMDRARKAISMGYGRVPGVVLAVGGKEEDKRMERRRWAVDGVLYWQKEVARLECAEGRPVRL